MRNVQLCLDILPQFGIIYTREVKVCSTGVKRLRSYFLVADEDLGVLQDQPRRTHGELHGTYPPPL
jgi:hypothetical protein